MSLTSYLMPPTKYEFETLKTKEKCFCNFCEIK